MKTEKFIAALSITLAGCAAGPDFKRPDAPHEERYTAEALQLESNKADAAGAKVLVQPFSADHREAALVQFPGGYIAEIHSVAH